MKKVLSLVLAIAMVLSSMSFAFASTFTDVPEDNGYQEAIETLKALGVIDGYEDGSYKPEKTVTRAEMAKLMVQLLGYGDVVSGQKSNFSDTQGHWADQWIALAAGRGIVVGTGNGKFNPEGIVTYDQVLTMLVRGLGYTDTCNELKNMPWPTNFKVKAAELNITKNVDMTSNQGDRGGVAQAMFNSLEQQLVKVNSDGDIVREYKSEGSDDKVPVRLVSRIANPDYDFVVDFEHINPDDKNYAGNKVDLTGYLFQSIEAYFNKNNDKEIVYVGKVNSLVYSDEFDSAEFDKDGKLTELTVGDYYFNTKGAFVSYNNDELSLSKIESEDDLDGAKITVVLDKDETRVKDGAAVYGLVVSKASAYVQIEEEYKADATEIDDIYLPVKSSKVDTANLIVKGDATKLEDIEVDDIVAAYAPFGDDPTDDATDKLTLVVARKTVEGEVTGTKGSSYYIDRVLYETNDALNIDTLEVGDEGIFYLDDDGRIIAFGDETVGSKTYAVVYDDIIAGEYQQTTRGYSVTKAPSVKLATAGNEKLTYKFDVEISKDGKIQGDFADLFRLDTSAKEIVLKDAQKDYYLHLVSYNLNKDNEITKFELSGRPIDMKTSNASFVLSSSAVIFDVNGKVISEDDLGSSVKGMAVYQNGKIVALLATNVENKGNLYYAYVSAINKDSNDAKDEVQRLTAFVKGAKTTTLLTDDKGMVSKKGYYEFEINDKNVVIGVKSAPAFESGKVTAIDAKAGTLKIDGATHYYDQGAATIIEFDEDDVASIVSKLSGIKNNTEIQYLADADKVVKYIVIGGEPKDDTEIVTGVVTKVENGRFIVDGKTVYFTTDKTVLRDNEDNIVLIDEDLTGKLFAGDQVEVKATGTTADEVKIVKTNAEIQLAKVKASYTVGFSDTLPAALKTLVEDDVDSSVTVVVTLVSVDKYKVELTSKLNTDDKVSKEVTVTVADASKDASLKNIKLDALNLAGFKADVLEYDVELTKGTTDAPKATAVENDAHATAVVTDAEDVTAEDGTKNVTTIVVTAEDGTTELTYKIIFTVAE